MSLETLLEAAEFIESARWRSPPKARGDDSSQDFHHYARSAPPDDNGDSSLDGSHGRGGSLDDTKEKRRAGGAGTREVHNKLEKNRRAHLKECFEVLKKQIPFMEDKKTSNLSILRGSLKYIQNLKRKEKEYEQELQRLAQEKILLRERITQLKNELAKMNIEVDLNLWVLPPDQETNSTSTATEVGSPIMSEEEGELKEEEEDSPPRPRLLPRPMSQSVIHQTPPPAAAVPTAIFKNLNTKINQLPHSNVPAAVAVSKALSTVVTTAAPPVRPPVTQILHQTLTQRQAMQRQQAMSQLTSVQVSGIRPVTQVMKSLAQLRSPITFAAMGPAPGTIGSTNKVGPGTVTLPVSSVTKPVAQPILVSATTGANSQLACTPVTTATVINPFTSVKNSIAQVMTSVVTPSVTSSLSSVPTIKPIIATPAAAAHLMSGHLALNPLLHGALPRTTVGQVLSTVTNMPGAILSSAQTPGPTGPQVMSLAHMGPVTPMTVMSPGVHMTGLSQTQLNSVLTQPILKQIPLLQPHLLQPGQVIGSSVVKPMVVVSVPSVTTTTPTVQVTVNPTTS